MKSPVPNQAYCDYCGLPVNSTIAATSEETPLYCCLGCRVAAQISGPVEGSEQTRWTMIKIGLSVFFSMNVMVYTIALWSTEVYSLSGETKAGLLYDLYRYVCLIFTLPVFILLGNPLFETTYFDLRNQKISTNFLLALGVVAAFLYSVISVFRGTGQVYFEIVCMVLVAVTIGRWLEANGKRQTTELLRGLQKILPDQVRLLVAETEQMVPLAEVRAGDLFRVLPGERIAVDGQITHNLGAIDEQMVTGEATPAVKEVGDEVFSGTLSLDGILTIRATSSAETGALEQIVQCILTASAQKDRYGKLADQVMRYFIPVVLSIAAMTFTANAYLGQPERGMLSALSVALIACPCALALAVPLALWTMLGRAAKEQVLLHNTDIIPTLAAARTLCIDKTGTLTEGHSKTAFVVFDEDSSRDMLLTVAATISTTSTHPISEVVREVVPDLSDEFDIEASRTLSGRGIEANLRDTQGHVFKAYLGSLRMMKENCLVMPDSLAKAVDSAVDSGRSTVCLGWDQAVRAIFVIEETLRADAKDAIEKLRQQGFRLVMLTGDHVRRAEFLAEELSLEAYGELLPADKVQMIHQFSASSGPVVMVGDGINDAPALAAADVGIALGAGSDLSRETADLCLLGNQLEKISWTIELARATRSTIRWNLWWAISYNTVGIAIAAAGWLNPIIAAIAMVVSSLLVVSNSLRLAHWMPNAQEESTDLPERIDSSHQQAEPVSYSL